MTNDQLSDLERIYGTGIKVVQTDKSIREISEIEPLVKASDIICAVLPIELLQELLNIAGDRPVLVGKNERIPTGKMIQLPDGTQEQEYQYQHGGWKQIVSIKIETKDL